MISFDAVVDATHALKAAFNACVATTTVSKEIKLLYLRQYLTGEALKAVEGLGHSATAYDMIIERLERKFGGTRRQTRIYLEQVEEFTPIKSNNSKDIERLADVLHILIINLK